MDKELIKLLARLTALKNNLPKNLVSSKYPNEFNSVLNELEKISSEGLTEFKVPESEIKRRVTFSVNGQNTYSAESYCDREYLLMKIDGVLGYFTLMLSPSDVKNKIGFHIEENE